MNYGTKIEAAVQMRDAEKLPVAIIDEEQWLVAIRGQKATT
jgi:hypothetical protein